MCGRFNVINTPGLKELVASLGIELVLPAPLYNVAPTESVPLLRNGRFDAARWWLTPHWAKQVDSRYAMFNARSETLGERAAFRKPFNSQRGVVFVSDFIEWRKQDGVKQPWRISTPAQALALAALWDTWQGPDGELLSCTLVTTAAAAAFEPWHHRMPVMLQGPGVQRWLDNSQRIATDDPLFAPQLKTTLTLVPVTTAVNPAANKSPQAMQPLAEPVLLQPDAVADDEIG